MRWDLISTYKIMRVLGHTELVKARDKFLELAAQSPVLTNVRPNGKTMNLNYVL